MKIAFYKGSGDIFDKIVRKWTKSIYSHCEIVDGNNWYSSSPRDGGVRIKTMKTYNPEHWDFIDCNIDKERLISVFESNKYKGYDWVGIIFSHIFKFNINSKTRMYCSEFVAEVIGIKTNITPGDLHELLKELV